MYADNTKTAYKCQLNKYLSFCERFGYQPAPASNDTLCRFVAFLADTMRPSSVKQYLNIVRIYHLQNGLDNPLMGNYSLDCVVKGVQRVKGDFVKQKLPITMDILQSFLSVLDLKSSQNLTFWAASLIAFFGMLRKASLFPKNAPQDHMCLGNCTMHDWGMEIVTSYSKTIQCKERQAYIVLPFNFSNSMLCPVTTLLKALKVSGSCQASDFVFTFVKDHKQTRMSYSLFTTMLRHTISHLKLPADSYSGHSFRRGSATHAFNCGLPSETIKAQGDWKSSAYLTYLDSSSRSDRAQLIAKMY